MKYEMFNDFMSYLFFSDSIGRSRYIGLPSKICRLSLVNRPLTKLHQIAGLGPKVTEGFEGIKHISQFHPRTNCMNVGF